MDYIECDTPQHDKPEGDEIERAQAIEDFLAIHSENRQKMGLNG